MVIVVINGFSILIHVYACIAVMGGAFSTNNAIPKDDTTPIVLHYLFAFLYIENSPNPHQGL